MSVATQAAEMQMEQTDIALANTLDTLMATGAGAGGAAIAGHNLVIFRLAHFLTFYVVNLY